MQRNVRAGCAASPYPPTVSSHPADRAAQAATRAVFFVSGLAMAAWAPLVPYAKSRLAIDEATLGALLLCIGIGSLAAMPLTGTITARFGCRRIILIAGAVIGAALPLMAAVDTVPLMAAALLMFGAGLGTIDVAMNIQAVMVERASGRAMMSGFHGMFSAGGIAGAGGVAALLWTGMPPLVAVAAVVAILALLLTRHGRGMLAHGSESDGPAFALPRGPVLALGALCFVCFLSEGSVLDWSALLLTTEAGMTPAQAGLGYALFAFTMTIGRLFGDRVVAAAGASAVVMVGALGASAGLALAVLASVWFTPGWPVALVGFALVGLGGANIAPVLFTAAGRQTVLPENLAVAAVTTLGYAGVLAGPAAIGFAANLVGLDTALLGVAALLLLVSAGARAVR